MTSKDRRYAQNQEKWFARFDRSKPLIVKIPPLEQGEEGRKCKRCQHSISRYNISNLCHACQEKNR